MANISDNSSTRVRLLTLVFFLLYLLPYCLLAQDQNFKTRWLRLLRYNKTLFGYKSEVDDLNFFLAKNGKNDPWKELEQNMKAMQRPVTEDINQHAACLYPARAMLLQQYKIIPIAVSPQQCPEYNEFRKKLNPRYFSIVFSSYYIGKPSSAFGHTLLKVKSIDAKLDNGLLDHGINYSAAITTNNPFAYGVFGIMGGFKGFFNLLPYYYKIREYSDIDSRDLWEYKLNLSQQQQDYLVAHLWEMNKIFFYYYYFDENCSYHLVRLLDAVNPDWGLYDKLRFPVMPVDTVRAIMDVAGLVHQVTRTPSVFSIVSKQYHQFDLFNKDQIVDAVRSMDRDYFTKELSLEGIELAINLTDYLYNKRLLLGEDGKENDLIQFKNSLNIARSKMGSAQLPKVIPKDVLAPHLGHESRRLRILYQWDQHHLKNMLLSYRMSLHSFDDYPLAFIPHSTLEMGHFRIKSNKDHRLNLEELTVARVIALIPFNKLQMVPSWKINLSLQNLEDTPRNENATTFATGIGLSVGNEHLLLAALLNINNYYSPSFQGHDYRLDIGPEVLVNAYLTDKFHLLLSYSLLKIFNQDQARVSTGQVSLNFFADKNFALNSKIKSINGLLSYQFGLSYYF